MAAPTIMKEGFVYRGGSRKPRNMTPRLEKDVCDDSGKAGLSAYLTVEDATDPDDWCQKIDIGKLVAPLVAYLESDGHVGIAPVTGDGSIDVELLTEWALSRGNEPPHALTNIVLNAIVEPIRRPP
jgi:hypothetical protein